jgi:hypothetical protein
VAATEQHSIDRPSGRRPESDELAARASLMAQIGRLEREHATMLARGFPHLPCDVDPVGSPARLRPRLQSLGELERQRDELVGRVRELCARTREREAYERRARALLAEMRAEPARHKFRRLAVRDLGEGSCGTWQVRPRLGLIGMLAGWWEVKLSSGCP